MGVWLQHLRLSADFFIKGKKVHTIVSVYEFAGCQANAGVLDDPDALPTSHTSQSNPQNYIDLGRDFEMSSSFILEVSGMPL